MTKKEGLTLAKKYACANPGKLYFVIDEPKSGIIVIDMETYACKRELHPHYDKNCVATVKYDQKTSWYDILEY